MNVTELLQTYFGPADAERLGRAAGLSGAEAERALREGLPRQLAALADHARTPGGREQLTEAMESLPAFGGVGAALGEPGGADTLQQAGGLLGPALLGERAGTIAREVAGTSSPAAIQNLLDMALPLLLSFLRQRGVGAGDLGNLTAGAGKAPIETIVVTSQPTIVPPTITPPEVTPPTVTPGPTPATGATTGAAAGLTAPALVEVLRSQLGGTTATRLGTLAGFSGASATRATQAALPVILGGLVQRGRTEAGAGTFLDRTRDFERLAEPNGELNPHLLDDPARVAQIEGQGRGLLGTLFGDADRVRGRLGSAIGGSGENTGRLLALLTPLVLGLVVGRARSAGLNASGFSSLLGNLEGQLPGLLPAGMSSLAPLLRADAPTVTIPTTATPAGERLVARTAPGTTPVQAAPTPPPPTSDGRRRVGWWWVPLLLLLLGGCYLLTQRPSTPTVAGTGTGAGGEAGGLTVTTPAAGASVPAAAFTMTGQGTPGDTLSIRSDGQEVATTQVGDDGTWQATVPAPAPGEQTYEVRGGNGATSGEVNVNVGAEGSGTNAGGAGGEGAAVGDTTGGTASGGTDAGTASGASASDDYTISDPTSGATLPAGGFTLRGTGVPGQIVQVLEDDTSLGSVPVGTDGTWSLAVPSPGEGPHAYTLYGAGTPELARVEVTVQAFNAADSTVACTRDYTLSIGDGQTVTQPFRFGGEGQGQGYQVTIRRGSRVVGTRTIRLDPSCGWSYQSRPGVGRVTYEVRPLNDPQAEPLSVVNLTVRP
ncbi:DUF937 domain-containing protein [Deinococcus sp. YIM 134068]|uniref:DUF937 domain-containing protein n=1 Tax=Deinococcus lichenicola TaxID=3118910 RepID=UPI002F949025